ncbi:MAG: UDP-N-acetylmuramoyl-L-alanyl-D-glutamate--2,6-diaminopimelate ligase [Clostridia bacterium]|nr:UDP-N-acetylmuramoyl-L-alanyl-D-glutamate--2,6-diaminopimelate ligase [Clostridia bacterium]
MLLSRLLCGVEILETNIERFDIEIRSVSADSRTIRPDDMFISIAGSSYNGHRYIGEALSRRAAVIVTEDKGFTGAYPYIRVPSTRAAYALIWNNLCHRPSDRMRYIAVTGTNGKSSTVAMTVHLLRCSGIKCEGIGTLNAALTTPDPPELYLRLKELADKGCRYVVMEASSHALEYRKLEPLSFDVGIFTNLTPEHLDFHGNMRAYAASKARLFSKCDITLYNKDDKYADTVTCSAKQRLSYSFCDCSADYICRNIRVTPDGCDFDFLTVGELFHLRLPLTGRFNVYNAMAACTLACYMGIEKSVIKQAMSTMPAVKGRIERVGIPHSGYSIFIDYAHTPDALTKILTALREISRGRLICVFGCGGDRDKSKRAPMGRIASELADRVIITSDNPRSEDPYNIIRDILEGIDKTKPHLVIPDRRGAIRYTVHSAEPGDVIVFCGKGHENYEINAWGKQPFDEKKIIEDAEKERIGEEGNEYNPC